MTTKPKDEQLLSNNTIFDINFKLNFIYLLLRRSPKLNNFRYKFPIKFNLFTMTTKPKDEQLFSDNTIFDINFQLNLINLL